jgi:DNA-binding beta-propeller fold protein YncE
MKLNLLLILLFFSSISCEKDKDIIKTEPPRSLTYISSFSTGSGPSSLAVSPKYKKLYVLAEFGDKKIESFSLNGELENTIVDFKSFTKGIYDRYDPIDFTLDKYGNICILANPLIKLPDNSWTTISTYSVIIFDESGQFKNEMEFSLTEMEFSAIAWHKEQLYLSNGKILKLINPLNGLSSEISIPMPDFDSLHLSFRQVSDMEIDSDGLIYLTGQSYFRGDTIGCYIATCNIRTKGITINLSKIWPPMCCAMFNNPGIYINEEGFLYLAGFYSMGIEVYDKKGNFILNCDVNPFSDDTRPIDCTFFDGKLYVTDYLNDQVHIFQQK